MSDEIPLPAPVAQPLTARIPARSPARSTLIAASKKDFVPTPPPYTGSATLYEIHFSSPSGNRTHSPFPTPRPLPR